MKVYRLLIFFIPPRKHIVSTHQKCLISGRDKTKTIFAIEKISFLGMIRPICYLFKLYFPEVHKELQIGAVLL